jgi:hypothetical protein
MRDFFQKKQRIVVRGLLERSGRILVVPGLKSLALEYYQFPGGYVEFGSDPTKTLVDLFFAQTHIPVDVGAPLHTISRMSPNDDTQEIEIIYRVYPKGTLNIEAPDREKMLWVEADDTGYFFSSYISETIRLIRE